MPVPTPTKPLRWILATALLAVLSHPAHASAKRLDIPVIDSRPVIDGAIGRSEWRAAAKLSDLHEVVPVEFSDPTYRTEWYIAYDSKSLYVAAIAHDAEPDAIVARSLSQGSSIGSDDNMLILVDAFNNKRSGYVFGLNPNGVRYDAIFTDGTRQSEDWEGIWRGAAQKTADGWSMEMEIPFTTLNFDPANDVWGFNAWRRIARVNETIAWQSQNGQVNPTVSGEIAGLQGLSQGKGVDLVPAITSSYRKDRTDGTTTSDFNPSLDVSYKIGNAVNALLTLNTDFSATEVDSRQLGLQRFSLFFPEKRTFFLTDFDIFQFGGVPSGSGNDSAAVGVLSGTNGLAFFSRRIGLSATREPVDILFGTKLSGRVGGFDFGTLYIRQDAFGTVGEQDVAVARVLRPVLAESTVGLIGTLGDPGSETDSYLLGMDFLYRNTRLPNNRTVESQWWIQKSDNDGVAGRDIAYNASISLPARTGLSAGAQYQRVEENFHPAVGFANRRGVQLFALEGGYNHVLGNPGILEEIETQLRASRWEYLNSDLVQSQEIEFEFLRMRGSSGDFMRFEYAWQKEGLLAGEQPLGRIGIDIPPGEYSFQRYGMFLRTSGHRPLQFELFFEDGDFFNGQRLRIRPEIEWRPNEHLNFELEVDYNRFEFPGAVEITRQATLEADVAFNSQLSIATLVQYDNVSDDVGVNLRFRYNVQAGRDIWLVLNHNFVEDPIEDRFTSTQTAAAFKIRYTFRY